MIGLIAILFGAGLTVSSAADFAEHRGARRAMAGLIAGIGAFILVLGLMLAIDTIAGVM